jgi:hypothetical protein
MPHPNDQHTITDLVSGAFNQFSRGTELRLRCVYADRKLSRRLRELEPTCGHCLFNSWSRKLVTERKFDERRRCKALF